MKFTIISFVLLILSFSSGYGQNTWRNESLGISAEFDAQPKHENFGYVQTYTEHKEIGDAFIFKSIMIIDILETDIDDDKYELYRQTHVAYYESLGYHVSYNDYYETTRNNLDIFAYSFNYHPPGFILQESGFWKIRNNKFYKISVTYPTDPVKISAEETSKAFDFIYSFTFL